MSAILVNTEALIYVEIYLLNLKNIDYIPLRYIFFKLIKK